MNSCRFGNLTYRQTLLVREAFFVLVYLSRAITVDLV